MSHKYTRENTPSDLQEKPQRRSPWRVFPLLFLGILVVLGGSALLVWQVISQQSSSSTTNGSSPVTSNQAPTIVKQNSGGSPAPQSYWNSLQTDIAQGIHLTVSEVKTRLHSFRRVADIAAVQGVSSDQLHTIEINALQKAENQLIAQGIETQSEVNRNMQNWKNEDPQLLDRSITNWFIEH